MLTHSDLARCWARNGETTKFRRTETTQQAFCASHVDDMRLGSMELEGAVETRASMGLYERSHGRQC